MNPMPPLAVLRDAIAGHCPQYAENFRDAYNRWQLACSCGEVWVDRDRAVLRDQWAAHVAFAIAELCSHHAAEPHTASTVERDDDE